MAQQVRLTQHCKASGCGCKLSGAVLSEILQGFHSIPDEKLLVGNNANDDSAVYRLSDGTLLLSTTDFFTPIVDDPFDYGYIASANAVSDIYAMGGTPLFALSLLAWPVKTLPIEVSREVVAGAQALCREIGIPVAGGHSIENIEPLFGLVVNGSVREENLKKNRGARPGDLIFLTKPIGTGVLSTAMKRGFLTEKDHALLIQSLKRVNRAGEEIGKIKGVHAMTDVTGFGLGGHLSEVCLASDVSASLYLDSIETLTDLDAYIENGMVPGGTMRNYEGYKNIIDQNIDHQKMKIFDPQTNGGLLISVEESSYGDLKEVFEKFEIRLREPIGVFTEKKEKVIYGS